MFKCIDKFNTWVDNLDEVWNALLMIVVGCAIGLLVTWPETRHIGWVIIGILAVFVVRKHWPWRKKS